MHVRVCAVIQHDISTLTKVRARGSKESEKGIRRVSKVVGREETPAGWVQVIYDCWLPHAQHKAPTILTREVGTRRSVL